MARIQLYKSWKTFKGTYNDALESSIRSSFLYGFLLAKVRMPPLHFTKLGVSTPHEHLLNIIQFQKRDKTPYQNISF